MVDLLQSLIDKKDMFEIVDLQISSILKSEFQNQMSLATGAGKDPTLWDVRVFLERTNPHEVYLNTPTDTRPVVNIWYQSSQGDMTKSNSVDRSQYTGIYNVDCYSAGVASDDLSGGHNPGDQEAAFHLHRSIRLVRNILMAGPNTYLQLQDGQGRRLVWKRSIPTVTIFQPASEQGPIQNIMAARMTLEVDFNEFSPQYEGVLLEEIGIDCRRLDTGEIVVEVGFD